MRQIIKENDKYYLEVEDKLLSPEPKRFELSEANVKTFLGTRFKTEFFPYVLGHEYNDGDHCGFHSIYTVDEDPYFECDLTDWHGWGVDPHDKCPLCRKSCFVG